ncbi:MAG: discoidin domain-containing protein [Candidatus Rokubacteria bacterium]|nr:discoidin domain-containing protein [Candidatus Rokubacteria bacterium]
MRFALLRVPFLWPDEATIARMGLTVLRGEFPVYFHGQPFMGALDAYLLAPLYVTVGASAFAAELLPALLSVAWLGLMARLAWTTFGPRTALFTAVLLALPSNLLLYWSHEARPQYPLALLLGTLALRLALGLSTASPSRATRTVALIGGVLGLALWTNFLSLVYFPPVAALAIPVALRRRLFPALLVGLAAFVLGSLPHWLYGLSHGTALPPPGGLIRLTDLAVHLRSFARVSWPAVAGVPAPVSDGLPGAGLSLLLAAVYATAVVAALRRARQGPSAAGALSIALVLLVAVTIGAAVGTRYGRFLADPDQRFFLPLYSALPLLVGDWLARLSSRRARALTAGLLLVHVAGGSVEADVRVVAAFRDLPAPAAAIQRGQPAAIAALEGEGPRRLYATDPWTRGLTFLSGERLVFSDPYQEIYPPAALAVDGAETVGWWVPGRSPAFEANLAALGVRFGYRPAGPLGGAYAEFALPPETLRELEPGGFTVTASDNAPKAAWMVDRDVGTLWRTSLPKRGGEWIQVDLGRVERVALVRWLPGTFHELPGGLTLELSLDGRAWQRAIALPTYMGPLYWSAGRPMGRVRNGRVELRVPPTPARHLRITQTGRHAVRHWTVRELFVHASAGDRPGESAPIGGATLAAVLRAAGVTDLYADHGWGARVALADPAIRIQPANRTIDAYGFEGPLSPLLPAPFRWAPGSAVLLEPTDAEGFAETARATGLGFTQRSVAGLVLFGYLSPSAPRIEIPAVLRQVTASRQPERAALAMDGDPRTRWATAHPQTAGDWLRVDLASPRAVRAVRLWTAHPTDWPRGLALEGSEDGITWQQVAAAVRTEGRLRFCGIAVLREGTEAVQLDFEPRRFRALRLTLTRGDPVFDWSVHELAVYGAE